MNRISVPIRDDAAKMMFYIVCKDMDCKKFDKLINIVFLKNEC